jgi:hypothetical protein
MMNCLSGGLAAAIRFSSSSFESTRVLCVSRKRKMPRKGPLVMMSFCSAVLQHVTQEGECAVGRRLADFPSLATGTASLLLNESGLELVDVLPG